MQKDLAQRTLNPVLDAAIRYVPNTGNETPHDLATMLLDRIKYCDAIRRLAGAAVLRLMWQMYVDDLWIELQPRNAEGNLIGDYTFSDFVELYLQDGSLSMGYYRDLRRICENVLAYAHANTITDGSGTRITDELLIEKSSIRLLRKCAQKVGSVDRGLDDSPQIIEEFIRGAAENRPAEWFDMTESANVISAVAYPPLMLKLNRDGSWTATLSNLTEGMKEAVIKALSPYTTVSLES